MTNDTLEGIAALPPDRLVAWHGDRSILQAELTRHVGQLSARLCAHTAPVINICEDRYYFLVGFFAAVQCRRTNLLPHNRNEQTVAELAARYPGSIRLDDDLVADWLQSSEEPAAVGVHQPVPDAPAAAVVFTSGSTGVPTAHSKSWQSLATGSRLLQRRLSGDYGLRVSALAATVPSQHMYGLEATVMLPTLHGWPMHCSRPFFPADVLATLAFLPAPRALITTPVHLKALLEAGLSWPELEFVLSSTAPLPKDLALWAEAAMNTRVFEIYGSSETGVIATRRTAQEDAWLAVAGADVRSREGAFHVAAPHLAAPVRLNDSLRMEPDGRFNVLGRDSDMIKIAGKRASLADLNEKLLALPGVTDGVVFLPDEDAGRVVRLTALVVAPGLSANDVRQALAAVVDPVFLPRPIHLVSAVPRNESGKPVRQALLTMAKALEQQA